MDEFKKELQGLNVDGFNVSDNGQGASRQTGNCYGSQNCFQGGNIVGNCYGSQNCFQGGNIGKLLQVSKLLPRRRRLKLL